MGIPFYGRGWSLESRDLVRFGDIVKGKSPPGFITGEEGVLGYNELCQMMQNDSQIWTTHYDQYFEAPYAYNGDIWIGYEDLKSISCKVMIITFILFIFSHYYVAIFIVVLFERIGRFRCNGLVTRI